MRYPKHLVLDFESISNKNYSTNWAINYLTNFKSHPLFLEDVDLYRKYILHSQVNKDFYLWNNQSKYTLKFNNNIGDLERKVQQLGIHKPLKSTYPRLYDGYLRGGDYNPYIYTKFTKKKYYRRNIRRLLFNVSKVSITITHNNSKLNPSFQLVNVNFLIKERLYTKLKYSRSPAYDSVSGGAAALFAGFIGFLISEKYGFELVDSGDFYYLFMYIVFLTFSLRPLLMVANFNRGFYTLFSISELLSFYNKIFILFMNFIRRV